MRILRLLLALFIGIVGGPLSAYFFSLYIATPLGMPVILQAIFGVFFGVAGVAIGVVYFFHRRFA